MYKIMKATVTVDVVENGLIDPKKYTYHHTATKHGYITLKAGVHTKEYKGMFGEGVTVNYPNKMGRRFYGDAVAFSNNIHRVDYYIKNY